MKKLFTILMGMLGMVSVSCAKGDSIQSVNVNEFEKQIKNKHVQLVDVRTAGEYATRHILYAVNIDVLQPDFKEKAGKMLDNSKPAYVYCRSGRRSMTAANILVGMGFKVVNLKGGIESYPVTEK